MRKKAKSARLSKIATGCLLGAFFLLSIVYICIAGSALDPAPPAASEALGKPSRKPFSLVPIPKLLHSAGWLPDIYEREDFQGSPDRKFVFINQSEQMMHIFYDGRVIRSIPCSTGVPKPGTRTPSWTGRVGKYVGTFESYGLWADHGWLLFYDDGAILIHSAAYKKVGDQKVYEDLDAFGKRPSSHGCIRISPEDAIWFTAWEPEGVLTMITPLTVY